MVIPDVASAALGLLSARHAGGSLILGGIDILLGLASQSILTFSWTDNTSDQADDLTIEIADPARTWMQTYLPKKGVECQATISVYNWNITGDTRQVKCGTFWLDQIDFNGPPNVVGVKAVSIPVTTGIKNQKKFRSWEGTDLESIANQIATENELTLVWDTPQLPKIKRTDQVDCADLEFLRDKCKEASLSLKIYDKQLVIYSEEEYEQRPAVYTITYGLSNILAYSFSSKLDDTYKKAKNAYVNPETGKLTETEYEPSEPPEASGATLEVNEQIQEEPDDEGGGAEAPELRLGPEDFVDYSLTDPSANAGKGVGASSASDRKTKSKLREKNKKEKECTISVVGNPDYLSGLNVQLTGFGIFDGKWFIKSSSHSIGSGGYTTELSLRAALNGY